MSYGTKNTTTPGCGFHHISIHTQKFDESMRLYRDVLGMQVRMQLTTVHSALPCWIWATAALSNCR